MVLGSSEGDARKKYDKKPDKEKPAFLDQIKKQRAQELKSKLSSIKTAVKSKKLFEAAAVVEAVPEGQARQNKLAELEIEYYKEIDPLASHFNNVAELYLKLIEAIHALHENGQDISTYLNLGSFDRLVTDVKGMDKEELKQIGDDLKVIQKRLN